MRGLTAGARAAFGASLAIALAGGCIGPVVEPERVPDDYTEWYRVDATGAVSGHGDSYRIIYVNQAGTEFEGTGLYPDGTVIVKEIHERDSDQPGALRYIGIMRKLTSPPDGGTLQGVSMTGSGWLFTYLANDIDSDEHNWLMCWDECHRAAPLDGAFLDYGP